MKKGSDVIYPHLRPSSIIRIRMVLKNTQMLPCDPLSSVIAAFAEKVKGQTVPE
jgi:hypothetical protein